jgi:hypothetical protein
VVGFSETEETVSVPVGAMSTSDMEEDDMSVETRMVLQVESLSISFDDDIDSTGAAAARKLLCRVQESRAARRALRLLLRLSE